MFCWRDRKGAFFLSFIVDSRAFESVRTDRDSTGFRYARQMPLVTVSNKVLAFHETQLIEAMDVSHPCTGKKKFSSSFLLLSSFLVAIPRLFTLLRITPTTRPAE